MRGIRRNSARFGALVALLTASVLVARIVRRRRLTRELAAYHLRTQGEIEQQLQAAQRRHGRIDTFQRSRYA